MASTALGLAIASSSSALFWPSRAQASPTARLVYIRGAGADACPDEPALKQRVAAHLGYDPFRPFVENTLFVEVRRERSRWVGSVRVVDEAGIERGARKLEERGDDCSEMTAALALSISIAIDPKSALSTPPPSPAPQSPPRTPPEEPSSSVSPPPPPANVAATEDSAPPPVVDGGAPVRVAIALGAHGGSGVTPHATFGGQLSAELAWTHFSAALEARADLPASQGIAPAGAVKTNLAAAALIPCLRWGWAAACGVALFGRVRAETEGVTLPKSELFAFAAAGLRLAAAVDLGAHFALRPWVEVLGTLTPFVIDLDARRVERSSAVSALGGIDATYFF